MRPEAAVKLIEQAVQFYIHQNYEVAANLWQLGYDSSGMCREKFEQRERMREALEMARKGLSDEQAS